MEHYRNKMFRVSSRLVLMILLLFTPVLAYTQQATVTGIVTDAGTNDPLPGANIILLGTNRGVSTDQDGRYRLENIPVGTYTLRISFVGYQNQDIELSLGSTTTTQNFSLELDLLRLDEVVVTALGILREEKSIGYAIQSVKGEDLVMSAQPNLVNALAGKAAGLYINSSSGQPGKSSRITVRGITSLLGNNQPLFVIDGIPISNAEDITPTDIDHPLFTGTPSNRALDIDPNIIQDVSILKGASATALYGSRASSGAIIITTRNAIPGQTRPRLNYSSRFGWDDAIIQGFQTEYLQGTNGYFMNGIPTGRGGYVEPGAVGIDGNPISATQTTLSWGPHRNNINPQVLEDLGVSALPVYDPRKQFYRSGMLAENSFNLQGGSPTLNYFLAFSNLNQTGIVPGTSLERSSLRTRFGGNLSDRVRIQTSAGYTRTENTWVGEGNGPRSYLWSLLNAPISFDITEYQFEDGVQRMSFGNWNNPFWVAENNQYFSDVDRIIASTQVEYILSPGIILAERISIDNYTDTRKEQINVGTIGRPNGSMFDHSLKRTELNSDLTLTIDREVNQDLRLNFLVGNNINSRSFKSDLIRGVNLNIPDFFHMSNASVVTALERKEERRLVSLFTQVTVDYKDYLYLTVTGRNDWSSTLPTDNNSYFYPSLSVGFVFTDALHLFQNSFLSFGRLRGAISQIGNDAEPYSLRTNFIQADPGDGVRGNIDYPFRGVIGYRLSNTLGNPALRPEISTEYEIGMDLRFFEGRMRLDMAYYDRTTKDQIFSVPVSAATGFTTMLKNAGELRNRGIEVAMTGIPVKTRNFALELNANFSQNKGEVVSLAEGVTSIYLGGFSDPQIRAMEGENNYGVIWSNRYLRNEGGQLLVGDDGLPVIAPDLGPIGNVLPDWLANLRATVRYKAISVSALVDIREGGDILNMDFFYSTFYGSSALTADRGSSYVFDGVNINTGEPNTVEIIRDETFYRNEFSNVFENFVEDGSYIKLREVSATYILPSSWFGSLPISSAMITATGRNLWIKSDFTYGDPEGNLLGSGNAQGFYHMVTPGTRGYTFGISITI